MTAKNTASGTHRSRSLRTGGLRFELMFAPNRAFLHPLRSWSVLFGALAVAACSARPSVVLVHDAAVAPDAGEDAGPDAPVANDGPPPDGFFVVSDVASSEACTPLASCSVTGGQYCGVVDNCGTPLDCGACPAGQT